MTRDEDYYNLRKSFSQYETYGTLSLICGTAAAGALLSEGLIYFFNIDLTSSVLGGACLGLYITSRLAYNRYAATYSKLWGQRPMPRSEHCNCGHEGNLHPH